MEILITKGKNRNTLTCKRDDGTWTRIHRPGYLKLCQETSNLLVQGRQQ